jgi:4-diphosphocytidyl-2-C-methyl-D-erythritol kinase
VQDWAGGSANAAATLTAMNKAYNNVLNSDELLELAATIGSDVAFCLLGGTACGSLRGEQLLPVNCPQKISFVIAKPRNLSLSTAWMYNQYDEQFDQQPAPTQRSHNFDRALSALTAGDIKLATQSFGNDFEPLAFSFHPELKLLQNKLIELGCISCHMTGKGPTLFAVVSDLERAHSICERLIDQTDNEIDVWVAQSSEHGVRFLGN